MKYIFVRHLIQLVGEKKFLITVRGLGVGEAAVLIPSWYYA